MTASRPCAARSGRETDARRVIARARTLVKKPRIVVALLSLVAAGALQAQERGERVPSAPAASTPAASAPASSSPGTAGRPFVVGTPTAPARPATVEAPAAPARPGTPAVPERAPAAASPLQPAERATTNAPPVSASAPRTVYRWTDREGKVHYGDQVPEGQRAGARPVDTSPVLTQTGPRPPVVTSTAPRGEGSRVPPADGLPPRDAAPAPAIGIGPGTQDAAPNDARDEPGDCASLWRRYDESQACFAPYRNALGGIKPEAFDHCRSVPDPSTRCGPRVTSP